MDDFFDLKADDFLDKKKSSGYSDDTLYNPKPEQGEKGIYKSVFRLVPYMADKAKSKYKKYSAKIVNPITGETLWVDDPSTVGQSSILWTLASEINALQNDDPEVFAECNKNFQRWYNYHSPIHIKKDPQKRDFENTIKWFRYGFQINNLITQQIEPPEELADEIKSVNPFHLLNGKDFLYVIKKKTKTFKDYSGCKFMDQQTPFVFNYKGEEVRVTEDPATIELTKEFLLEMTPSIDKYLYQEWTDETYEKVATFIKAAIPYQEILDRAIEKTRDVKMKELLSAGTSVASSNDPTEGMVDEVEYQGDPTAEEVAEDTVAEGATGDADVDDILANM